MNGYFEENDPLKFRHQVPVLFPTKKLYLEGSSNTGRLTAVLPKSEYAKLSTQKKLCVDKCVLSKDKAETYAKIFAQKAENRKIPWILGPASLIPGVGWAVTVTTSTIDGLNRLAEARSVTPSQLEVLMAKEGAFLLFRSLEKHAKHGELLVTMVFYSVTVGAENRLFGICSDKYALSVAEGTRGGKPAASRKVHKVVRGDSLSAIAKLHYGDAAAWKRIYDANRAIIGSNPNLIRPGMKLTIPPK